MARIKVTDIDKKIAELLRIADVLNRLAQACRGRGPTSECPILDMLEQKEGHDER